jgi:hypothetical protein
MTTTEFEARNALEHVLAQANEEAEGEAVTAYVGLSAAVAAYLAAEGPTEILNAWAGR